MIQYFDPVESSTSMQGTTLITLGGLRGTLCLIMVQTMILDIGGGEQKPELAAVKSAIAMWTTGIVLFTACCFF